MSWAANAYRRGFTWTLPGSRCVTSTSWRRASTSVLRSWRRQAPPAVRDLAPFSRARAATAATCRGVSDASRASRSRSGTGVSVSLPARLPHGGWRRVLLISTASAAGLRDSRLCQLQPGPAISQRTRGGPHRSRACGETSPRSTNPVRSQRQSPGSLLGCDAPVAGRSLTARRRCGQGPHRRACRHRVDALCRLIPAAPGRGRLVHCRDLHQAPYDFPHDAFRTVPFRPVAPGDGDTGPRRWHRCGITLMQVEWPHGARTRGSCPLRCHRQRAPLRRLPRVVEVGHGLPLDRVPGGSPAHRSTFVA